MRLKLCVSLAAMLSISAAAPAAPPTIYNLGALGGYSEGADINASGQVVGNTFLYTGTPGNGGVMHDLFALGMYGVSAINDSGQVAGWGFPDDVGYFACRYTGSPGSGGVVHILGTLGGEDSAAYAINNSGQVTGASHSLPSTETHAFLYTGTPGSGGVMHDLGTLGGFVSSGLGINATGQVVGESQTLGGEFHAFLYTGMPGSGGVMRDLGTLGGTKSVGEGINDSGHVVGSSKTPGDAAEHAYLYTGTPGSGGVMHDLGTLGGGRSDGLDINVVGDIVGSSVTSDGDTHAFVYTGTPGVDGVMIDLDAWLDAAIPVEGSNWTLANANGLNDSGLITGGGHYYDGPGGLTDGYRAYLLDASSLLLKPSSRGDFDADGDVDGDDLAEWSDGYGLASGAVRTDGDADGDDDVDGTDFLVWQRQVSGATATATAVPEPAAGALALLGLTAAALGRRRLFCDE